MATPAEILSESECTVCGGADMFQVVAVGILRQILVELDSPMTQAQINSESSCYVCYGMSQSEAAIVVLLNAVAVALGGGSGDNISGAGSPVGVVTPDTVNQWYYDTVGIAWWFSTGLTNSDWIQAI